MKIHISFPKNIITEDLLSQDKIPCLCKVSREFEIFFFDSNPQVSGVVADWDRGELELRAVPSVGGQFTHNACSLITIKPIEPDVYEVVHLEMFNRSFGWCVVIAAGAYAEPGKFWDEE